MKKWCKFFCLSFFSHKLSKEGAKRGYANIFLGFIFALIFLWAGFVSGDMLPFGVHYSNAPDFMATVHTVFANADSAQRIEAEIENGVLKVKKPGGQYAQGLLVNTFENAADKQIYAANGYDVVIDSRPADTLAEIEASCISNDGKNMIISYEEYLALSDVAKLNFDFQLRYTGNALLLNEEAVKGYRAYVDGLSAENEAATEALDKELAEGQITEPEYFRAIYELYFASYYPEITAYESTSKVPLLRNYYQHQYISKGIRNYLFIFDDYITGSFETKNGIEVPFYGFYSELKNGALVQQGATQIQANAAADDFIQDSFEAVWFLYAYSYAVNVFTLVPFIVLMLMVATLLTHSVLKLRGVESVASLGAMFKINGSFVWFSAIVAAVLTVIISFFAQRGIVNALQLVLFFVTLVIRSIAFAAEESKQYTRQLEQQKTEQTT